VAPSPEGSGAKLVWSIEADDSHIDHFVVIEYPGGFGYYSFGATHVCKSDARELDLVELSPGVLYQFQVIAVDSEGNESIPSKATEGIQIKEWVQTENPRRIDDQPLDSIHDDDDNFEGYDQLAGEGESSYHSLSRVKLAFQSTRI